MITGITKYLIIALVLASAAAVGILTYQNQGLEGDKEVLTLERNEATTKVTSQQRVIETLEADATANEEAHKKLLAQIAGKNNLLSKHEQTIRDLERENEQLKIWSITPLPSIVSLFRERPAITGSEAYREWLSSRDAVPVTGNPTSDKR